MKTLFRTIVLGLLLSGWGLAALSLHVIRTPTEIGLIPKDRLGVTDTYVDTRKWTLSDVADHPLVVSRVLATNQVELLRHIDSSDSDSDLQKELVNAVKHSRNRVTTTTVSDAIDIRRASSTVKGWWAIR